MTARGPKMVRITRSMWWGRLRIASVSAGDACCVVDDSSSAVPSNTDDWRRSLGPERSSEYGPPHSGFGD